MPIVQAPERPGWARPTHVFPMRAGVPGALPIRLEALFWAGSFQEITREHAETGAADFRGSDQAKAIFAKYGL
ncbi:hypothetical protein [Thiorhodococcus minor]|uniref:Uncharacterized protein n=1 Tax=Thiorhodococcus minor TaxID=57489 RepID=A0A6M0K246_9GAMM|nr:hypothetical protein [Thiorhodococcus minor]NEV63790.1 hypothetical protein [Thiorhodococcus minor]